MFEILEHTADIGFKASAPTREEMFIEAARALVAIALDPADPHPARECPLAATAEDLESLLVNWLNEVLYAMDGQQLVLSSFRVASLDSGRVLGFAGCEPRDPQRHPWRLIVKGVTYHQLRVTKSEGLWTAWVYLDV